jgi:hypothetical protein
VKCRGELAPALRPSAAYQSRRAAGIIALVVTLSGCLGDFDPQSVTRCTVDADCVAGYVCDPMAKACVLERSRSDGGSVSDGWSLDVPSSDEDSPDVVTVDLAGSHAGDLGHDDDSASVPELPPVDAPEPDGRAAGDDATSSLDALAAPDVVDAFVPEDVWSPMETSNAGDVEPPLDDVPDDISSSDTGELDDAVLPDDVGPDDECTPLVCTAGAGCIATPHPDGEPCGPDGVRWCQGGACVDRGAVGDECAEDADCAEGRCREGVCCDADCGSLCESCRAAETGLGDGQCGWAQTGRDPHDDCEAQALSTCGTTGACDGFGGCALYAVDTPCLPATCVAGALVPAGVCLDAVCVVGPAVTCDDGETCTTDDCDATQGTCENSTEERDGSACDADGSVCTQLDRCQGGACVAGEPLACNDGSPCTLDECDAVLGCRYAPGNAGATCSDDDACTIDDRCAAGECQPGAPKACDDDQPCTADGCVPESGQCTFVGTALDGSACDADGSVCTQLDRCQGGACVAGEPLACNDGSPCTLDECDAVLGCRYMPGNTGATCSDDDACTIDDRCAAGECQPGAPKACDDDQPCTADSCVPESGQCTFVGTALDGSACDADGSVCTQLDRCQGGVCVAGSPLKCSDGNPCTLDQCHAVTGCQYEPGNDGAPCEDLDGCTVNDVCAAGECRPGGPRPCSDALPCTLDSCDPVSGSCVQSTTALEGSPCDADGNVCTELDACRGGLCVAGKPLACSDDNPCTLDTCHPVTGCGYTNADGATCSDGNPCTLADTCLNRKCEPGTAKKCTTTQFCQVGVCDQGQGGACKFFDKAAGAPCNDGDSCTELDRCDFGACAGVLKECTDGNLCTTDSCDSGEGCLFTSNSKPCTDSNPCTLGDVCADRACRSGAVSLCDDQNPCTNDACNSTTGACSYSNAGLEGTPCDLDSNACTEDFCYAGSCQAGSAADDGSVCGTITYKTCLEGECVTPLCPQGYQPTTVDVGGNATTVCGAVAAVWGALPNDRGNDFVIAQTGDETTVTDTRTGLEWARDVAGFGYKQHDALSARAACDGLVHGGEADWRLPTFQELASLWRMSANDYQRSIDEAAFSDTAFWGRYLTSTPFFRSGVTPQDPPTEVYAVAFPRGQYPVEPLLSVSLNNSNTWVRCVRTVETRSPPLVRFQVSGTGQVVLDSWTGLRWQRTPTQTLTARAEATSYCDSLVMDGKSDWRMPTITELASLLALRKGQAVDPIFDIAWLDPSQDVSEVCPTCQDPPVTWSSSSISYKEFIGGNYMTVDRGWQLIIAPDMGLDQVYAADPALPSGRAMCVR